MQDQEVGDGTTSVVIFAAELLQRASALVRQKIHPTSIIGGYRLAMREVQDRSLQWPSIAYSPSTFLRLILWIEASRTAAKDLYLYSLVD